MGRDFLRRFVIPSSLMPKVTANKMLLRPVDVAKGGHFGPPSDFGKAIGTNIHTPGFSSKEWTTNLCEIVDIGNGCQESAGWDKERPFKVGQWVTHMGASPVFFIGQEFACCQPEFIILIVKEPEVSKDKLYEIWNTRGELPVEIDDKKVTPIGKKKPRRRKLGSKTQ